MEDTVQDHPLAVAAWSDGIQRWRMMCALVSHPGRSAGILAGAPIIEELVMHGLSRRAGSGRTT